MNATDERWTARSENDVDLMLLRLRQLRDLASPGSDLGSAREVMTVAMSELEALIPSLTGYVSFEGLLSKDYDREGRDKLDERLSEIRFKLRELTAILESGARVLDEHLDNDEGNAVCEGLNTYLVASITDMLEVLETQHEAEKSLV